MSCSRRNFLAGTGAVIFTTGVATTSVLTSRQSVASDDTKKAVRYGMLHDENACIGCTACTDACREVNKVPEGVSRLEIHRSEPIGEFPDVEYRFIRDSCQHCENPPCVYVCPTGAAYKDEETGIIDVHNEKCVGCGYCLAACPYQVRFFNPETRSADKCNFCRDTNLAEGKLPACVESCPTNALVFGDLNDPNSDINKMKSIKVIYRDKEQLGTKPKLFKVPFHKGRYSMSTWETAFHFDSLVWDWIIAIYLFLAGMSAGSALIAIYLKRKVIEGDPAQKWHPESYGLVGAIWHYCWSVDLGIPLNQATRVLENYDLLQPNVSDVDGCDLIPSLHGCLVCVDWHDFQKANYGCFGKQVRFCREHSD